MSDDADSRSRAHRPDGGHSHGHSHAGDDDHGHDDDHDAEGDHAHAHHDHDVEELAVAVLTVSSTRTVEEDPAGDAIEELLHDAGHAVAVRRVVDDGYDEVQSAVSRMADRGDVDVTVTTGGTGVTPDDVTVEAVEQLFVKRLPGFGELFRRLSYDDIGTRVVATRATAGVVDTTPTFALPGSENAARLGTREIIVPEAPHLTGLARRSDD